MDSNDIWTLVFVVVVTGIGILLDYLGDPQEKCPHCNKTTRRGRWYRNGNSHYRECPKCHQKKYFY